MNTQSELIEHLRFMGGDNATSLPTSDAVRLLNFALDRYSYLAITTDGRWQFDDTENTDLPRASITLSAGDIAVPLNATHLTIRFAELTDASGNKTRLKTFDRRGVDTVTPRTTDTGQPYAYDYEAGVLYFDQYVDDTYTLTIHFSRAATHLTTDNTTQVVGIPTIHTEYLVLYAAYRNSFRTNDEHRPQLREEVEQMEQDVRDFYGRRDEDTPAQLKAVIKSAK